LALYNNGARITPTAEGTIIDYLGVSIAVKNVEDFQIIREIFQRNSYNFNLSGDVCVVDIGMNVGLASLYFAGLSSVRRVYSFEPFEAPFRRALENFSLNPERQAKIRPCHFGLGGKSQELSVLYDETSTLACSLRGRETGDKTTVSILNASEALAKIIKETKPQGFQIVVKMDCEGSEFDILERLDTDGLLPEIRILMMEWHKWWSPGRTQKEIISRLIRNGFDVLDHTDPFDPWAGSLYAVRSIPDSPYRSMRHHRRAWKSWRKREFLLSPAARLHFLWF
jgi:FkbM family methyltransferase